MRGGAANPGGEGAYAVKQRGASSPCRSWQPKEPNIHSWLLRSNFNLKIKTHCFCLFQHAHKMFVRVLAAAVLAAVVTVSSAAQQVTSLMFQVEPKTEDCIHEDLKAGSTVDAQVLVTRGGKLDVRFRVRLPSTVDWL